VCFVVVFTTTTTKAQQGIAQSYYSPSAAAAWLSIPPKSRAECCCARENISLQFHFVLLPASRPIKLSDNQLIAFAFPDSRFFIC